MDVRREMPWDFGVCVVLVLDIPNPLLSKPSGAEQDEMLPCNRPRAEFLPDVFLLTSSELHQGEHFPWCLDVAQGLLPKPGVV